MLGRVAVSFDVRVISGEQVYRLAEEKGAATVPAGQAILAISPPPAVVEVDGQRQPIVRGAEALIPLDLSRSTGFHHLHIAPGHHFWFATEDAKAKLEGVESMLRYLAERAGTAWTGQLLFSDGSYLRDGHVVYGWLDRWASWIIKWCAAIVRDPRRGAIDTTSVSEHGGPHIARAATNRLLRRRGRELLERSEDGPVVIGVERYTPRRVVFTKRTYSLETLANLRALWVLRQVNGLIAEVLAETESRTAGARCREWRARVEGLLGDEVFGTLARTNPTFHLRAGRPSTHELMDERYQATYAAARDLDRRFGWSATRIRTPRYAYVNYADEIYQAFVAVSIAEALGLSASDEVVGRRQPTFRGKTSALYVNMIPPPTVLRSWRSFSAIPDSWRPDLLWYESGSGAVLLFDAKYRLTNGQPTEASRKELMAYMAAYGLSTAILCFPSPTLGPPTQIAGRGRRLIELPVSPLDGLAGYLAVEVRRLLNFKQVPPFST